MKVPYAARFAALSFGSAALYTGLQLLPGLPGDSPWSARQSWSLQNTLFWSVGWWLWLIAIFSWMLLLVVLVWSYLPAHRVASMLQSGLMISAAVLAIAGVTVWMALLPVALDPNQGTSHLVALVDTLAMSLLGAGCFMGGAVTAWISWDLLHRKLLARFWLGCAFAAGLALLPAPFLGLHPVILTLSLCFWLVWCLWLATRPALPRPFSEWK